MTEYELTDAINSTMSVYASAFTQYLTIISAYLIAGVIAGDRLTREQFIIISVLFFFASGLTVFAMSGAGTRIAYTADALRLADVENPIRFKAAFNYALAAISTLGIIASFKFWWDIRHPKS
jgi:hypothetical protein